MSTKPTAAQMKYLSFMAAYIERYGEAPSEADIASVIGVSAPSVNAMVRKLVSLGFITRESGVPRSIDFPVAIEGLPKWRGKMPGRTVQVWATKDATKAQLDAIAANIRPERPRAMPSATPAGSLYRIRIDLIDTEPLVWRRVEVPDMTLEMLHDVIQLAMGWEFAHLHQFEILHPTKKHRGRRVGEAVDEAEECDVYLSQLVKNKPNTLRYTYDFGDNWVHIVKIEKLVSPDPHVSYPRCVDGASACPMEDCGGVYGHAEVVAGEHWMLDEFDIQYDPDKFDRDAINRELRRLKLDP